MTSSPSLPGGKAPSGVAALIVVLAGCGAQGPPLPPEESVAVPGGGTVAIFVEADRHIAGPILKLFSEQSGIEVRATYRAGMRDDFLAMVKAETAAGRADLVWATTPLTAIDLSRSGLAVPFRPAGARPVLAQYRDPLYRWIGFAVDPRVIIYNRDRVQPAGAPQSIEGLTSARWTGRVAMSRIARGTPAFHAAALFSRLGEERARAFFEAVRKNGARIAADDREVRRLVASGEADWGLVDLNVAICAKREADPVNIVFPDRFSQGAVVAPHVAVLLNGAPNPAQARGLHAFLFATETAWQLGQNDCALVTLLPEVPKPDWVPALGAFNVTRLDNDAVYDAYRAHADYFESWGAAAAGGATEPGGIPAAAGRGAGPGAAAAAVAAPTRP
jgi:ABC-type Fe3+ transport system substrate-binding protein/predicted small lipoprotein YifL